MGFSLVQWSTCIPAATDRVHQGCTSHWIMAPRSAVLPHRQRTVVFCWALLMAMRPFTSPVGERPLLAGPADLWDAARAAILPKASDHEHEHGSVSMVLSMA